MFRSVFSVVALTGALAMAHPVFADPVAAAGPDTARVAVSPTQQPAAPEAAGEASSTDTTRPTEAGFGNGIVPVGFGWG